MLRRTVLVMVLALLPTPLAVATDSYAASPASVVVLAADGSSNVQVAWLIPESGPADTYRVYGYTGTSRVLLVETALLTASVAGGYASYAVAAVYGGVESAPAKASPCTDITIGVPPQIGPLDDCP